MNNQFSENLKKIRKDYHLSQEQLADELGVSRQAISKWESSVAYPEMDKIIALCDKFDLNIDDLLHKDIKEIKGEEESKKKLSKFIDDFLGFITDTINLFSNMKFKSKIKCLLEQTVIIGILFIISFIIINIGDDIFYDLLFFLPSKVKYFINNFLNYILALSCLISSIIILTHVFKIRYLDYYDKLKNNIDKENIGSNNELASLDKQETMKSKNRIMFRKNENKIIIRDPNHSEYRFINGLFKLIVGIVKFFSLCFALFISSILIVLFIGLIISFLVYKTGFFFLGLLIAILSQAVIIIIVLLTILNFVFNRKNDKKKMIWSFIISLVVFGCGIGLIFIGTLKFEILDNDRAMLKKETIEYEMQEDTFFNFYYDDIKYVEADIDNIKVEYEINKFCELHSSGENSNHGIDTFVYCPNPIKLAKEFIRNINNKQIVPINNEISNITVYASKENIEKLKINRDNYYNLQKEREDEISYYQERINSLEIEIADYETKFSDYEDKISELNAKIEEYKSIIESYRSE